MQRLELRERAIQATTAIIDKVGNADAIALELARFGFAPAGAKKYSARAVRSWKTLLPPADVFLFLLLRYEASVDEALAAAIRPHLADEVAQLRDVTTYLYWAVRRIASVRGVPLPQPGEREDQEADESIRELLGQLRAGRQRSVQTGA